MLLMHVIRFLKFDHSVPSEGRSNLSKNVHFGTYELHLCGRRFHIHCTVEFNQIWCNNYIEGVVDAR